MREYLDQLQYILDNGTLCENRTGIDTISVFGMQARYDLSKGFPAVTTKKLAWKSVVSELLWFLEGSADERRLAEIHYGARREYIKDKRTIWTDNADNQARKLGYEQTDTSKYLGPIYGYQWRAFDGNIFQDQISDIIDLLRESPDSRRIVLTAWNPNQVGSMALPPCHVLAQFRVQNGKLSCLMYQRSADFFLGVPFNIASYALLTHIFASICDLEVADLVHSVGDGHIYSNHIEQVREQLNRNPLEAPTLTLPNFQNLHQVLQCGVEDFVLENYNHHPAIFGKMAI